MVQVHVGCCDDDPANYKLFNSVKPAVTLFDDIIRLDDGHPDPTTSNYDYLNASARPEAARIRALLDEYFLRYPPDDRVSLRGKFRSSREANHATAVFELVLHELLLRHGHDVRAIEPVMPGVTTQPDFLVSLKGTDQEFVLEAVLATGTSEQKSSSDRRVQIVLDALNRETSTQYFLSVSHRGAPRGNVSLKSVKRTLRAWIAELPASADDARLDRLNLDLDGLKVTVSVLSERPDHDGREARAVGVTFNPAQWVDRFTAARQALEAKASRYGELGIPFVIAVNVLHRFSSMRDATEAIYGGVAARIRRYEDGRVETTGTRLDDGFWSFAGTRNSRASAVMYFDRLTEWDLARRAVKTFYNPASVNPLPLDAFVFDSVQVVDNEIVESTGSSLASVLGLSSDWPEEF